MNKILLSGLIAVAMLNSCASITREANPVKLFDKEKYLGVPMDTCSGNNNSVRC